MFLQIGGAQILAAVRIHKQGYPKHLQFSEFYRKFRLLVASGVTDTSTNIPLTIVQERVAVEELLLALDLDPASYRLGLSQVTLSYSLIL